jgi:hypothetical protein
MDIRSWLLGSAVALASCAIAYSQDVVRPVGCLPDDAYPCLQQAIDAAAQGRGSVVLPTGTYLLKRPIALASDVSIIGQPGAIIAPSPDNTDAPALVYANKVSNVRIEGVVFDGHSLPVPQETYMITLDTTTNVVLAHVTLQHMPGHAINFVAYGNNPGSGGNGLEESLISDVGNKWRTTHKLSDRMQAVIFWDESWTTNQGNFARKNHFENTGLDALQISQQDGFLAEGNTFDLENGEREAIAAGDYGAGIFVESSIRVVIRGNTIHGAQGNGIDAPGLVDSLIENNTITESGQAGIGIFRDYDFQKINSSNVIIRNNVITNNAIWPPSIWRAGISIGNGTPADIKISGNTITDTRPKGRKTQDYGIHVVNTTDVHTRPKRLVISVDNDLSGNQRARTRGL